MAAKSSGVDTAIAMQRSLPIPPPIFWLERSLRALQRLYNLRANLSMEAAVPAGFNPGPY
jgi:hypothetical protein